jgi:predicted transcriptional regulator
MAILTIEIDKERDLPALDALLTKTGLEYQLEEDDDDWGDLPEAAIEGIKAGLADAEAGRTHSHEYVMAEMKKTIAEFRRKNGQ